MTSRSIGWLRRLPGRSNNAAVAATSSRGLLPYPLRILARILRLLLLPLEPNGVRRAGQRLGSQRVPLLVLTADLSGAPGYLSTMPPSSVGWLARGLGAPIGPALYIELVAPT